MDGNARSEGAVLVPTGYDPASYPCVRSLNQWGVRTILASEHDDVPASASRFCDETVRIPSPSDDAIAYKDALIGIAARPEVRTVIPIRPVDTYLLSKYRAEFERYVTLLTPGCDTLRTVHDRVELVAACEAAGVPAPRTRLLSDVRDWSGESIVKSRYNVLAAEYVDRDPSDVEVVKDVTHVRSGDEPDVETLREAMKHEPIVQEFVPTEDEYMFAALYDRGEPLATFQHEQIRGNSYTGGGGVYRKSMYDQQLEDTARALLDHLDYHGLACIEYMKHAETGEYYITEINPRMWQSLPATVRAGADFPLYYWLAAAGRPELIDPEYDLGVGSHLLYGEAGHLASVLTDDSDVVARPSFVRRAAEIGASILQEPNFDIFRADDPRPFLRGVGHVLPGIDRGGREDLTPESTVGEGRAGPDTGGIVGRSADRSGGAVTTDNARPGGDD
jgi:predicted ATP-grasp superfamily ATP-dependent carboligase